MHDLADVAGQFLVCPLMCESNCHVDNSAAKNGNIWYCIRKGSIKKDSFILPLVSVRKFLAEPKVRRDCTFSRKSQVTV